jgi:hypothetical protein
MIYVNHVYHRMAGVLAMLAGCAGDAASCGRWVSLRRTRLWLSASTRSHPLLYVIHVYRFESQRCGDSACSSVLFMIVELPINLLSGDNPLSRARPGKHRMAGY